MDGLWPIYLRKYPTFQCLLFSQLDSGAELLTLEPYVHTYNYLTYDLVKLFKIKMYLHKMTERNAHTKNKNISSSKQF